MGRPFETYQWAYVRQIETAIRAGIEGVMTLHKSPDGHLTLSHVGPLNSRHYAQTLINQLQQSSQGRQM
jgi:hypothetical protein